MRSNPSGGLAADTSADIEQRQIERWRRMSPAEKLALVEDLRQTSLTLASAGIRQRYPSASESECTLRLRILTLGRELAERVYPAIRELHD